MSNGGLGLTLLPGRKDYSRSIDEDIKQIKDGVLGDIAPTILEMIGIPQPELMTQKSLISPHSAKLSPSS